MIGWLFRLLEWLSRRLAKRDKNLTGDISRAKAASTDKVTHYVDPDTTEWAEGGKTFKRFADGQVGEDITNLDVTNVDELRRVYGPAGIIPDEKLVQWAAEAKGSVRDPIRQAEIRKRLAELESEALAPPVDDGYRPAGGIDAGTSPKHGVVLPPAITDHTTNEWANLTLEQAYGPGAIALPAGMGYSMRYLNELRKKAEARTASAYELSILRSRGLV